MIKQIAKEVCILRVSKIEEIRLFLQQHCCSMRKYIKCIFCEGHLLPKLKREQKIKVTRKVIYHKSWKNQLNNFSHIKNMYSCFKNTFYCEMQTSLLCKKDTKINTKMKM